MLFIAYYCGGYVAGRMARFNGMKQGIAVWIWTIIMTIVIAVSNVKRFTSSAVERGCGGETRLFPTMTGRMLNEPLGRLHAVSTIGAFILGLSTLPFIWSHRSGHINRRRVGLAHEPRSPRGVSVDGLRVRLPS